MSQQFNLTQTIQRLITRTRTPDFEAPKTVTSITDPTTSSINCDIDINSLPKYVQDKFQTINQLLLSNLLTDHGKQHFTKRLRQLYSDLICNQTVMFENSPERKFIEMFIREVFPSNETYLTRHLLDAYADSLIYVNFLYNKAFGVQSRHVHIEPYRKWHSKNVKNRRISDQTDWC
ncbi:hypothetical protein BLOT_013646 [Blomia tropicalis]|nr:hypothetical protein BLOT_013646 [Blomia tropicalis]